MLHQHIFPFRVSAVIDRASRARYLGSLLRGRRSVHIPSNISGIVERPRAALDSLPDLLGGRRNRLRTNEVVNSRLQVSELALHETALGEAGAEEGGVDGDQDPGALGEGDGGEEESDPEHDFENGDEAHGGVIVFLDELADGGGHGVGLHGGLRSRGGAGGGGDLLRWLQGWDQVCAGVGCDVEDRVDAEGEHCEGVLRGEEPDKGHGCQFLLACC